MSDLSTNKTKSKIHILSPEIVRCNEERKRIIRLKKINKEMLQTYLKNEDHIKEKYSYKINVL